MINSGTPTGVPSAVDCAIRSLAWKYGKTLLPERGEFKSLFDAMQLSGCNLTSPALADSYSPPLLPLPPNTSVIVVSAAHGDDEHDGSHARPLATIPKALDAAAASLGRGIPTAVLLRAGTYHLTEPLSIGPQHSGLTMQNFEGEAAVLSAGVAFQVPKEKWSPYLQRQEWHRYSGANNVYNQAFSKKDRGAVKFLGSLKSADECEAAAKKDALGKGPFRSFTFHLPSFARPWAGQCFGRTDDAWAPASQNGAVSGWLLEQNTWVAQLSDVELGPLTEMPGLRLNGRRVIRAKYPDGDPELSGENHIGAKLSFGGGQYVKGWMPLTANTKWVPPSRKPDSEEVIVNAQDWPSVEWPMHDGGGSRWTGEGDWGDFHIGVGGYCDDLNPPVGYWCAMHPPRGQAWNKFTNHGSGACQTHMSPDGMVLPRAASYSHPEDAVVHAWRGGGRWFTQQWAVSHYVPANQTLMFDRDTGFQGGEGMTSASEWWIENVLEECDSAREFFYDKRTKRLYFNPNSTAAGPDGDENWVATYARVLINVSGSMQRPVKGVTISGLSLRDTRYTYMDVHGMPSGGDWALQRSGAIVLEGTEDLTVSHCELTNLDANGISINGYNRRLHIDHNDMSWIGDSAITAWGHTSDCLNENCSRRLPYKVGPDGRAGEQPRFTTVSRNLVREVGLWQKQSSMWFQAVTAQTSLVDNVHFNGPRAGINFNDGFGGADVIRGNLLANCVRESGDHGPFNSWDRVPYITTINSGKSSIIPAYREISHNFIVSTYASQEAIDTDDGSAYYNTTLNFFAYAANGLKSDFGGHNNHHEGNVYAWVTNCWGAGIANRFVDNVCISSTDAGGFRSDCRLPRAMVVSGTRIYNKLGNLSAQVCNKSNRVFGVWPSAAEVVQMGSSVLQWHERSAAAADPAKEAYA